ncbi:FixH family protein [Pedobacter sp.]|uniref:FixH family protein n=1 Tax=Pedobacter sp. TaxID=1411316 RepID=UPI003D7F83C5
MNWGTKLIIGMLTFMTFIGVLATLMITSTDDALVDNDYYEKGINYNKDYDKKENVKTDKAAPAVSIVNNQLVLTFSQAAEGSVKLIRTANKKMDQQLVLKTDTAHQFQIPLADKAHGLWKLEVEWSSLDKTYLYDKEVML